MKKALVLGATGAVGKDLVERLLSDDAFGEVDVFVRRPVEWDSSKLRVHIVDFDRPEEWNHLLSGDVLFSCLGTTIKAARENSVHTYVLVSAVGASSQSKIFYSRMKGTLDEAVRALGFPACFILRPPSLIRKGSDRFGEKAGVAVMKAFNAIGLLRAYRPLPTEDLADAMISFAKSGEEGVRIVSPGKN